MRKFKVDTTYHRPDGLMQPTACPKLNKHGELVWMNVAKSPWHLKMLPNRYNGDFMVAWMWSSMFDKGHEWTEED